MQAEPCRQENPRARLDVRGLTCGDKRWAGRVGCSTQTPPPPTTLPGAHCPHVHPRGGEQEAGVPIPSMPVLLSWDGVWILHKTSGISINFWALQRLLTFHEMQREIEVINLAGQGGSSTLTFPMCYVGCTPQCLWSMCSPKHTHPCPHQESVQQVALVAAQKQTWPPSTTHSPPHRRAMALSIHCSSGANDSPHLCLPLTCHLPYSCTHPGKKEGSRGLGSTQPERLQGAPGQPGCTWWSWEGGKDSPLNFLLTADQSN